MRCPTSKSPETDPPSMPAAVRLVSVRLIVGRKVALTYGDETQRRGRAVQLAAHSRAQAVAVAAAASSRSTEDDGN